MSEMQEQPEPTQPVSPEPVVPPSEPATPITPAAITPGGGVVESASAAQGKTGTTESGSQRGTVRSIHYTLSYIVRNAERGPRGAIVLLHDFPGGAFTWSAVLPLLEGTGRAVYAFDMLGYGESDHSWPSDTSIWGHADCLTYAFQALDLRDIVLVGFGVGGSVAQVLATRLYRDGVARLVLLDSYGYEYAFAPDWPLTEMAKRQDPEAPLHTPTAQVLADLRATLPQASAKPKTFDKDKLDTYVNEWNSHIGKELLFQHARLLIPSYSNAVSTNLKHLERPALLIWGQADGITPTALGERMAREMPSARLETIPGAGHLVLDDAPEAVGRLIADFAGKRQE